jgi:hypothetical protein
MSDYQAVMVIVDEMWTQFMGSVGKHDPSAGETWFKGRFAESVELALGRGGDWDREKETVYRLLKLSGELAAARSEITNADPDAPLTKLDVASAVRGVRMGACDEIKGRWCHFVIDDPEPNPTDEPSPSSKKALGSYDIDVERVRDESDAVMQDIVENYRSLLRGHEFTDHAKKYFLDGFAESIADRPADYNKDKLLVRRLLKLACRISVERAELTEPYGRDLTTNDVWFGLVAARWAACPLDEYKIGPEGRWCNFLRLCPPEDPDCEVKFEFKAGAIPPHKRKK